jgi:hypothetical protein
MRRLVVFVVIATALLSAAAATDWWVDPFGEIWKPRAVDEARASGCLLSQELVGNRYLAFKLDVFRHRPTRTFVVGSSRVLKIESRPGERQFANLGYPGTAPETIARLFRSLRATPRQTVYMGVESFWFNRMYRPTDTDPSDLSLAQYLVSRNAFEDAVRLVRQAHYVGTHRWRKTTVGRYCTIGRTYPSVNWQLDGSRVWSWEIDPARYPKFSATKYAGDLALWRNGYYDDWTRLEPRRVAALQRVLALAHARGWRVVGFAPPEPASILRTIEGDPRIAPRWSEFMATMPKLFAAYGYPWIGLGVTCPEADFPDEFHTDAACSSRLRARLDEAARRLH